MDKSTKKYTDAKAGVTPPKVDAINYPENMILKDSKGNTVTRVGEDGIKRAVRGIQSKENTPSTTLKGRPKSTSDASVEAEKKKLNIKDNTSSSSTSTKTNTKVNNKGKSDYKNYTEKTGKQTQRGTGKTYEDVWNTSSAAYKKNMVATRKKQFKL